ncbi:MAG: nuclear transport factor 2 family protein [Actinomycetes bacterium]
MLGAFEGSRAIRENRVVSRSANHGEGFDPKHAEFLTVAQEWSTAMAANDAARIESLMTDDWVIVSDAGISVRELFLSAIASGELTVASVDFVAAPRVRVYGDTAVRTVRVATTAYYQADRYDADEWVTDVFVRRDGRWRCALSQITTTRAE